jgi:hypothetical protein
MWQVIEGAARGQDDITAAIRGLDNLRQHPSVLARDFFVAGRDVVVARVPRTVELSGGLAGPLGGRSLHWSLADAIFVSLQRDERRDLRMLAPVRTRPQDAHRFELPLSYFERGDQAVAYEVARDYFNRDADRLWAMPLAGLALAMMREQDAKFREGLRVLVEASSTQGPEAASTPWATTGLLWALHASAHRRAQPRAVAQLAQRPWLALTPNLVDAGSLLCGLAANAGALMAVDGSPGDIEREYALAPDLHIWCLFPKEGTAPPIAPEPVRRFHLTALIAHRVMARLTRVPYRVLPSGRLHFTDRAWRGHLAPVTTADFPSSIEPHLPESATGAHLLKRFGDPIFTGLPLEPDTPYAIRSVARYLVDEQERQPEVLTALTRGASRTEGLADTFARSAVQVAQALGLSLEALADLQALREVGAGVLASRLAWSGTDSVFVVVGTSEARGALTAFESRYWVLGGSSPGAITQGHLRLRTIKSATAS